MRKFFALLIIFILLKGTTYGCTNFLISKGATVDGSTMITYAADSHVLYGELYFWPRAKYNEADSLDIYEWDTGKFLGRIKQAMETFQVTGNMNEYQVAIAETTYGGKPELVDSTAVMDYGSLIYITLQRAKTAREAIHIMNELVTEYGYCSSGESLSIADPNEVWIMEIIGKGVGNKGAVWVARKVPDGYICGHANQSRITTFPQDDPENCLFAKDVISFARKKGYFSGENKDFDFSAAYAPLDFGGARFCEARVYSGFRKVAPQIEKYEKYAMGYDLEHRMPLWVKPEKKLTVRDVMNMMRDYFQGTPMDMTKDAGAGPYGCIVRWRPLTWEIDGKTYFNERAISTQQTGFSFVSQSRNWLPNHIGGRLWFGVDDTYSTVYTPIYCGISEVPHVFEEGNGTIMDFSETSAFWLFNQVSNLAYTRYNLMIPFIRQKQDTLEYEFIAKAEFIDKQASKLSKDEDVVKLLTDFSKNCSNEMFAEWKSLYQFLFVRFLDGNIKTKVKVPENYKYVNPKLEQPGYNEEWYRKLIEETGDKFLYHGEESH